MGASYLDRESEIPSPESFPATTGKVAKKGQRATNAAAQSSFWLGLLSFLLSWLAGIPAFVYGVIGLVQIRRSRGHFGGSGLAIAGMIFAAVGSFVPILLLMPAT